MADTIDQLIAIGLGNGTTSYIAGADQVKGSFASLVAERNLRRGWVQLSHEKQWRLKGTGHNTGVCVRNTQDSFDFSTLTFWATSPAAVADIVPTPGTICVTVVVMVLVTLRL